MTQFSAGVIFASITGLCWAVLAIILEYALHFASTGTIVWVRMLFAALLINGYFIIRSPKTIAKVFCHIPYALVVAGLFLSVNYFGYMTGIADTSASNAQIAIQLGPLLLALIGVFYFKESMVWQQWFGVAIAIVGFIFFDWGEIRLAMHAVSASVATSNLHIYFLGSIWIIFAGVSWALFATIQKSIIRRAPLTPQETNLLIFTVCALALLPAARFSELSPFKAHAISAWGWFILFILGLNTVIAYGAFAEAIQRIPASYVSLIIVINPLVTILLVALIAKFGLHFIAPEPIHWRGYLGAVLVVGGVATTVSLRRA